jgi:hypothetical protein
MNKHPESMNSAERLEYIKHLLGMIHTLQKSIAIADPPKADPADLKIENHGAVVTVTHLPTGNRVTIANGIRKAMNLRRAVSVINHLAV